LGMAHYLLVRTDLFHAAPLAVMVSVLAAWAIAAWLARPRGRPVPALGRSLAAAGALGAAVGLGWALAEGLAHRYRGAQQHMVALRVPTADGVDERPVVAAQLVPAVDYVRAHVPAGGPIYVTGARADLVTSGNPLFYVLAERRNPTRYDIAAPGVVTSA